MAVQFLAERTFSHCGKIGDVIFALPFMRATTARTTLCLGIEHRYMGKAAYDALFPLLMSQPYIKRVCPSSPTVHVDCNLDSFRNSIGRGNLCEAYFKRWGVPYDDSKWLDVAPMPIAPTIFARSPRNRCTHFPWAALVSYYTDAIFVGLPQEHEQFESTFGCIDYYPTHNLLELARVIAGAERMLVNPTGPHAVAEGLKCPLVIEGCGINRQFVTFNRADAIMIGSAEDGQRYLDGLK